MKNKESSASKIVLDSYESLFGGQEDTGKEDRVRMIPLSQLHEFAGHPFRVLDDEKMQETVESVKKYGVLVPGIARKRPQENGGGYEIISGHRRRRACELAGLTYVSDSDAKIVISGTNNWKFYKNGMVQFAVVGNKVNVSTSVSSDEGVTIEEQIEGFPNAKIIEKIAKEAIHQSHGTTVVFTDEAEDESCRLSKFHRCELIRPIDLCQHKEYILPLTSIDGALIVGTDGECYGVGAILDGEAVKPGSIGRGARYNSALNYVAWRKRKSPNGKYCAVIISEDGIVNIITTQTVDGISDDTVDYL